MCRHRQNCYMKSAWKSSANLQSVPKEHLPFSNHSIATISLPLCKCNRCETHTPVLAIPRRCRATADPTFTIRTTYSLLYASYVPPYHSIFSLSPRFFFSKRAKNVEFFSDEIHFAYHSKYLYSFVGNLELLSVSCMQIYAGQPKRRTLYYPFT